MTTKLVLEQAIWTRSRDGRPDLTGLVHHHDHSSRYTSLALGERPAESGIRPSVGAVGSSYDNATG